MILEAVEHRGADTWGVNLRGASAQGLDLKFSIGDAGSGLRAGQKLAWPDTPRHGDVRLRTYFTLRRQTLRA